MAGRKGLGATAAVFAMVLSAPSASTASAYARAGGPFTFGNPAFCAPTKLVRDFGLSRLPPVREVPEKGNLPFGPKTVSLVGWSAGRIIPVGNAFGYELWSENYVGRTPLHWTVRARMAEVDRKGRRGPVVDRKEVAVRTISNGSNVDLLLYPQRRPGFYLYEIEFVARDGKVLGRYGEYLKVFARSYWKARLGLSKQVAAPGQQVLSRVENLGTEPVLYGEEFYVQRLEDGSWVPVPNATPGGWLRWLGKAGPGASGRCSAWHIPVDFPLGQYRIVKKVFGRYPQPRGNRYLTAPIIVAIS
jgi:hypothetical protein